MKTLLKFVFVLLTLAVVAGGGWYVYHSINGAEAVAQSSPREVRWFLAHEPIELYSQAQEVFKEALEEESGGTLTLSVRTPSDLGFTDTDVTHAETMAVLAAGNADISSVFVTALQDNPSFAAVGLPYLFTDMDAAKTVFEGAPGATILSSLSASQPLVGLAFTLSGGFRIIASPTKNIRTAKDLEGLRVGTSGGASGSAVLTALGAKPVTLGLHEDVSGGDIDAVETTYTRISALTNNSALKFITETNHSLFLTAIVSDKTFYDSLTPAQQGALMRAAQKAAAVEREDSVALGVNTREALKAQGVTITTPSAAALAELKKKTEGVYTSVVSTLPAGLLEALRGN